MKIVANAPYFPKVDVDRLEKRILEIPAAGKNVRPKRVIQCSSCRRRADGLIKIVGPGTFLCDKPECEWIRGGLVGPMFPTPYGRGLPRKVVATFSRLFRMPSGRVFVEREPVVRHARALAEAYASLIHWQRAYDTYERTNFPEAYAEGRVSVLPPRTLEDTIVVRIKLPPIMLDPTERLPEEPRLAIRAIARGETSMSVQIPF